MRHVMLAPVLLVAVLLVACAPVSVPATRSFEQSPLDTSPPPTTETPAVTEEVSSETTGRAEDAVIIYRRSGGLAGVFERWTVYPDGLIVSDEGNELRVQAEEVSTLLAEIEALGFFEMSHSYGPLNACCDRFTHQVTVRSGDSVKTVRTIDAAPDTPPELWRVIEQIRRLVSDTAQD